MKMTEIPFGTTDWDQVDRTEHKGDRGVAYWREQSFGGIRVPHRSSTASGAKLFIVD
ncbi:MAG TPA: hypothetical protein VGI57_12020 [Usitatibacter sp.]